MSSGDYDAWKESRDADPAYHKQQARIEAEAAAAARRKIQELEQRLWEHERKERFAALRDYITQGGFPVGLTTELLRVINEVESGRL